jgi:protein-disulfide isomerase
MLAAGALGGCGDRGQDASEASTTSTTAALLAQPRGEDLSTTIDAPRLASGEPAISIDFLGVNLGSVEAPLKVIEFVDFGCGFCRQFHAETFSTLAAEYVDTGIIEWKLLPFVTGMFGNSEAVTNAAECALEQDIQAYAAFTSLLWDRQSEWKSSADAAGLSRRWITEIGADVESYDTCLAEGTRATRIASANAVAAQLGIRSTPTFWVVGLGPLLGALPVDAFRQVFDQLHQQITQEGA